MAYFDPNYFDPAYFDAGAAPSPSIPGGRPYNMLGQLLGVLQVTGPQNLPLNNVSGLSALNPTLLLAQSAGGESRYSKGTTANATYGMPIAENGTPVEIHAGPFDGNITLSVPASTTLTLGAYKQPRIANEF